MRIKMLLAVCTMAYTGLHAQIPSNGLILHYPFDGNTNDASGNNRNAVATNSWYVTGANGSSESAISMDGDSSSAVYYEYTSEWNNFNIQDFTVATWVKMDEFDTPYSNIFELGNGQIFLRFVGNVHPQFGYYSQAGDFNGSETNAPSQSLPFWKEWHHIALSSYVSGINRYLKFYVDGTEYYSMQVNGPMIYDALINHNTIGNGETSVKIGYRTGNSNLAMDGSFQDYVLYNRALNDAEVTQLYNNLCMATSSIVNVVHCGPYSQNNETFNTTGQYFQTIPNAQGCDSIITLNLTVHNQVNTGVSTVQTVNGPTLVSQDANNQSTFQWLNCDQDMAGIEMANSFSFLPTVSGNYAVVIENGTCTDTSECVNFTLSGAGIEEHIPSWTCYPNPAQDHLYFTGIEAPATGQLINNAGQEVMTISSDSMQQGVEIHSLPAGTYFLRIQQAQFTDYQILIKH